MRYALTTAILILAMIGGASALTIHVRDSITNSSLNATINITYNAYSSGQEQANINYSSAQNSSGSYFFNISDPYFYITYAKTSLYSNFTWQLKTGQNTFPTSNTFNVTNISSTNCWQASPYNISLRFYSIDNQLGKLNYNRQECYNGSSWVLLTNYTETSSTTLSVTNATNESYDADYSTLSGFNNETSGTYSKKWISNFNRNTAAALFEEKGYWWINSSSELVNASLGVSTPPGQINYTGSTANVSISIPGYTTLSANNIDITLTDYYFNATPSSTTTFYFYDENTNALITNTVTISLSGAYNGTNGTTSNGSITFGNLTNDYYTITYSAVNYSQRYSFYALPSSSSGKYFFFLLPTSNSTVIQFTLLGETYQPLANGLITAQKRNVSGSNYYAVAQCTTDSNGNCLMNLQLYTSTYKFLTNYGYISRYTNDSQLSTNTFTIVINTRSSTLQNVIANAGTTSGLTYNNNGSFTFIVNDVTGRTQYGSLIVNRRYGGSYTTLGTATGSGTSFSIVVGPVNTTVGDEIIASGYVNNPDGFPVLTQQYTINNQGLGTSLGAGSVLLFVGMAFTLVFIFAWNPIAPMLIFGVLFLLLSRIGIVSIGSPAVISILVVIFVGIYRMRSS